MSTTDVIGLPRPPARIALALAVIADAGCGTSSSSSATKTTPTSTAGTTRRGARGFILPPVSEIGNPGEETLLPATAAELHNLDIKLRRSAARSSPTGFIAKLPVLISPILSP